VNLVAATLAGLALLSYVLVYTPLKRSTPLALHVGAVPGALPPLIGYASVAGGLDAPAYALGAILLVWQLPHFMAIAIFRQSDYSAAGLKVYPVALGLPRTRRAIVTYSVVLLLVSLLPVPLGIAGLPYAIVAGVTGLCFLVWSLRGLSTPNVVSWARSLFLASMPYLVILFTALVASAM
jgi:protoheme IX farnesyltransferase